MPSIMKSSDIFDACELRRSGKAIAEISAIIGWGKNSVFQLLRVGGASGKTLVRPCDVIVPYIDGTSENAISKQLGIERIVVHKVLVDHCIPTRSVAEANRQMMLNRSPEENRRNTEAAHLAAKGKRRSPETKKKIALARERNVSGASVYESILAEKLMAKGLEVALQKAVECYNIDIAIPEFSIAVEVFGGHWHSYGRHARRFSERFNLLLDRGWIPVIVWISNGILTDGCVDYIVSLCDASRLDQTTGRCEHVIYGNGKPSAIGDSKFNYGSIVGSDEGRNLVGGEN